MNLVSLLQHFLLGQEMGAEWPFPVCTAVLGKQKDQGPTRSITAHQHGLWCFSSLTFITFCSNLYYLLPLFTLPLVCSFSSVSLYSIRLSIWDFPSSLMQSFTGINFFLRFQLLELHPISFGMWYLQFHSAQKTLQFLFWYLLWLTGYLRVCCLNFIIAMKFPSSFLFVISNFIPLWWEAMCSIMALLLNLFILWASIWFILENVPCTLEKHVFCCWLEYSTDVC